jgi:hypothetical protein
VKTRRIVVTLVAGGLLAAIAARVSEVSNQHAESATHAAFTPTARASVPGSEVIRRMRARAYDVLHGQEPGSVPMHAAPRSSEEVVETVARAFHDMEVIGGLVHTEEMRDELSDRLLEDAEAVRVVRRAVAEPEFAKSAFGERSAEARYFAVKVLKRIAQKGDDGPLREAVRGVAGELTAATLVDEGRAQDLKELLEAFAGVQPGALTSADLRDLGYRETLPEHVRAMYDDGVFLGLWRSEGYRAARTHADALFRNP